MRNFHVQGFLAALRPMNTCFCIISYLHVRCSPNAFNYDVLSPRTLSADGLSENVLYR